MSSKVELLKYFEKSSAVEVAAVTTVSVPAGAPESAKLVGYHPGIGPEYRVVTKIGGNAGDEHLTIIPVLTGTPTPKWNKDVAKFIESIEYVPVPSHARVPNREVTLVMRKKQAGALKLHDTNWYLAYSRICKTSLYAPKEASEVILLWQYAGYDEYVGTCWKWLD